MNSQHIFLWANRKHVKAHLFLRCWELGWYFCKSSKTPLNYFWWISALTPHQHRVTSKRQGGAMWLCSQVDLVTLLSAQEDALKLLIAAGSAGVGVEVVWLF